MNPRPTRSGKAQNSLVSRAHPSGPSTLGFSIFAMQLMAVLWYFPRDSLLALGQSSGNAAENLGRQAQRQMGLCPGRQTVPLQS